MRSKGSMSNLGNVVATALDKLGLGGRMREAMVLVKWNDVVGDRIARVTRPLKMSEGVLFVACKSAVWANELSLHKDHIKTEINRTIGSRILKEIRFSSRGFGKAAPLDNIEAPDIEVAEIGLSEQKEQVADAIASTANSDQLAEAIRKAVITSLKREKAISVQQESSEENNSHKKIIHT